MIKRLDGNTWTDLFAAPQGFAPLSNGNIAVNNGNYVDIYEEVTTVTISGNITDGSNPLSGVVVSFSNGGGSATTDASGNYSNSVSHGYTGVSTPSKSGYSFSPVNKTHSNVTSDVSGQDYVGALGSYSISGNITDGSNPLSGITVSFSGIGNVVTDANGYYSISVSYGTSTTATPSLSGYSFTPASRNHSNVTSNASGQDYVGALNNRSPIGTDISIGTREATPVLIDLFSSFVDPDGDSLVYSFLQGLNGSVVESGDTAVIYNPVDGFIGNDSFEVEGTDPEGLSDTITVSISVTNAASIVSITGDQVAFVSMDYKIVFGLVDNGSSFTPSITSSLGNSYLVDLADSSINGTPTVSGEDLLTLTLSYDNGDVADKSWGVSVYSSHNPIPEFGTLGDPVITFNVLPDTTSGWFTLKTPIQDFSQFYSFEYDTLTGLVGRGIDSIILTVVDNGDSLQVQVKRKIDPVDDFQFTLEVRESDSLWHETALVEILLPNNTLTWGNLTYTTPFIFDINNPPAIPILYYASEVSNIVVKRVDDDSTLITRPIMRTGAISEEVIVEEAWLLQDTTNMNIVVQTSSHELSLYFRMIDTTTTTGIKQFNFETPKVYSLSQNYPNPFNPTTKINFSLPHRSEAKLVVYNIIGEEITVLFNGNLPAGEFLYEWNSGNLSSGIYIYRLIAENFVQTKKMILLK